jgi:hypothetical protein
MRWSSEISVTVSLAAGVCVVPLVTVPVILAAEAPLAKANKAQSALNLNLNLILIFQTAEKLWLLKGTGFSPYV